MLAMLWLLVSTVLSNNGLMFILQITPNPETPQKVCANCEYQLESSMLLWKRIKFTQSVWTRYQDRIRDSITTDDKPIICDKDLLLNCHLCASGFDYRGLQSHLRSKHGTDHVSGCELCMILLQRTVLLSSW